MKKNFSLALLSGMLLLGAFHSNGQPASIAGDALIVQVTSATGEFYAPAYYLLLPADFGASYQSINISGSVSSGGDYTYTGGPVPGSELVQYPSLQLMDPLYGTEDMSFGTAAITGSFTLTAGSNNVQTGNVWLASSNAPRTLANHSYYLNIVAGSEPFASHGSVIFTTPPNQTNYTVYPTSGGISPASGSYEYYVTNASTGYFSLNDSASGSSSEYFAFTNSNGGLYMVTQASGGFQMGTFAVSNLIPSLFFMGQVDLSSNVEWLEFSNSIPFGLYNVMDFGFPLFYHYDLGFEYFFNANDGANGGYLYDFASKTFFYTSPSVFPYVYDFNLNSWLYYYPDTSHPGRYTSNPRYFYEFANHQIITK